MTEGNNKNILVAILVVVCVLCVFSIFQLISVKQSVSNIEQNLNNISANISNLRSEMSYDINNTIYEDNSLLISSDFTFENIDSDNMTADITVKLVPKEFTEESSAVLICNGEEYAMTLLQGEFNATIGTGIFTDVNISRVIINTDGQQQTEILDWQVAPVYQLLPIIDAHLERNSSYSKSKYKHTANLAMYVYYPATSRVLTAEVHLMVDGKVQETIQLIKDSEPLSNNIYYDQDDEVMPEYAGDGYRDYDMYVELGDELTIDMTVPATYEWQLEARDNNGLVYKQVLQRLVFDGLGNVDDMLGHGFGEQMQIFDESGNLLYTYENEKF